LIARLAPPPVHGLLDLLWIETGDGGQHPHGLRDVVSVLAIDRHREGMPVVDQHLAVAIEQHAARGAQREGPLIVVLGQLDVRVALDDLEEPEAEAEHREERDDAHLQRREAGGDSTAIFSWWHVVTRSWISMSASPRDPPPLHHTRHRFDERERHGA